MTGAQATASVESYRIGIVCPYSLTEPLDKLLLYTFDVLNYSRSLVEPIAVVPELFCNIIQ